jgi:Ca2+-binding EF-hand superfamily protein
LVLEADCQDVIFFSATGPVRLRFHLQLNGKTFTEHWTKFADQIFDYCDRNDDGKLDKEEARFLSLLRLGERNGAPSGFIINGESFDPTANAGAPQRKSLDFVTLDTDKNGFVSREEFVAGLNRSGFGPIEVVLPPPSGSTEQLTAALFKHLDKNTDGKLSKEEMDAGVDALMRLDQNEDEIITAEELLQKGPRNTFGNQLVIVNGPIAPNMSASGSRPQKADILPIRREATSAEVVQELIVRLDKDKNGKLSKTELTMSAEAFAKLDKNGDGQLDSTEIVAWLKAGPDVELAVPLGGATQSMNGMMAKDAGNQRSMEVKAAKGSALAKVIQTGADGVPRLFLPDAILSLTSSSQNQQNFYVVSFLSLNGQFDEIFKMAAGANKGLDKKKIGETPQLQYILSFFDIADRNGDGILELAELNRFLKLQSSGRDAQVQINVTDEGRGLFDLIDANHDGRLSMREIRNAWKQVAALSKDGKSIDRESLPKQIPMYVHRVNLTGSTGSYAFSAPPFFGGVSRVIATAQQGPAWFQKMDRNGDGDVSRKEFLGPPELFDRLDKDGDGLISLQEGENAEKAPKK